MGTAITEPDAGSDILSILTFARKDGNDYVINGSKQFITNGSIANYLVVFCLTHPEAESRLKRFGVIIVETDRPGFGAIKINGKDGDQGFRYSRDQVQRCEGSEREPDR